MEQIKVLTGILKSEVKRRGVVEAELAEIQTKYTDRRRTQIINLKKGKAVSEIPVLKDVIPHEKVWITVSNDNKISKFHEANAPRQGGKDAPKIILSAESGQTLYLANQAGKCAAINIQPLPFVEGDGAGISISKVSSFSETDTVIVAFCIAKGKRKDEDVSILTMTRQGLVKRSKISELPGASADLFTLVKLNEDDEFLDAKLLTGEPELLVITELGMGIRFDSQEVRCMGLVAAGVNALKLSKGDKVSAVIPLIGKGELLAVADNGTGWRVDEEAFPKQARYGSGVIAFKMTPNTRIVGVGYGKKNYQVSLHLKKAAAKIVRIDEIPAGKRATAGKKLLEVKSGDGILAVVNSQEFYSSDDAKPPIKLNAKPPKKTKAKQPVKPTVKRKVTVKKQ